MYLIIFEDSTNGYLGTLGEDEFEACKDGIIQIFDVAGEIPREWMPEHGWEVVINLAD